MIMKWIKEELAAYVIGAAFVAALVLIFINKLDGA